MPEKDNLPYKTINVFIDREYLESVLRDILGNLDQLPKEGQISFVNQFKKYVTILGFRNPMRAPLPLQVNAFASAFEEKDEVIPFTLTTWTRLNSDFAKSVEKWLKSEGWEDLNAERTFVEGEGFSNDWPEELGFDELIENYESANPDIEFSRDDLILMVLWLSGKLPEEQSEL